MYTLEAALEGAANGQNLLPADAALQGLPQAWLTEEQAAAIRHGQAVRSAAKPEARDGRRVRMYGPGGAFLGLAEAQSDGRLQPRRLISSGVP